MALKHFVLSLCVAATFSNDLDVKEKTPDNNPFLNLESLGSLQDAWQMIRNASEQNYYAVFSSVRHGSLHTSCMRFKTNITNETMKTATYSLKWYSTKGKVHEKSGEIRTLKDYGYTLENVMRMWYWGDSPEGKMEYIHGSYITVTWNQAYPTHCYANILDKWWAKKENYTDDNVVVSHSLCYVTRKVMGSGTCDFWVNECLLYEILTEMEKELRTKQSDIQETTHNPKGGKKTSEISANELFMRLPLSCRLGFLYNCGPPHLTYNKDDCQKLDEMEIRPEYEYDD